MLSVGEESSHTPFATIIIILLSKRFLHGLHTHTTPIHTSPAITFITEENKCRDPSPSLFWHTHTHTVQHMMGVCAV